jgi:hypothetical protein
MQSSDGHSGGLGHDGNDRFWIPQRSAPERVREALNRHPHFYGRADRFQFELSEGVLVVTDTVPTYYLRQLLQGALTKMSEVRIDNRVDVVRPEMRDGDACR